MPRAFVPLVGVLFPDGNVRPVEVACRQCGMTMWANSPNAYCEDGEAGGIYCRFCLSLPEWGSESVNDSKQGTPQLSVYSHLNVAEQVVLTALSANVPPGTVTVPVPFSELLAVVRHISAARAKLSRFARTATNGQFV